PTIVHCASTELRARNRYAGEVGDRLRTGHERERVVGHHDLVEASQGQGGSGDAGAGDCEHGRHNPRHGDELAREAAPRMQRRDALTQLGSRRVELADEWYPELPGEPDGPLYGFAAPAADCIVVLSARDPEPDNA